MDKSVGAVIFKKCNFELQYLLIQSQRDGFWGFAKGHVEDGECEEETAKREILEETGLAVFLVDGFRTRISYLLPDRRKKEAIYFLAEPKNLSCDMILQEQEIADGGWYSYQAALAKLSFDNSREVLTKAHDFLSQIKG